MVEKDEYWIIGYKTDFDFIIVGENTGPYLGFPLTNKEAKTAKGTLHYLNNFVSQINGKRAWTSHGPLVSKCPALDDWNNNVREPMKSFEYTDELMSYLKELARPCFRRVYFKREGIRILKNFSTKGLAPN